ncbi:MULTISPECIES: hypothetical protein [Mycobacteriaceae]|uniref:Uncharacterized protein n=1 Tax=Mycolicibacterium neoaurum VKM Ac-1815D TaxID=700508 RepID=V5XJB5_MYCNE|nr:MULTISPECIES: hypothetical protein [Mycobacteriaceae]AHC27901.1 hypothetical protein D174_09735 [Mycolicibacterium neoaurum VKM Ac-1815D]AMO05388.1 hypothetical protein MyAD_09540 [Mycolicibacterium neoaurum]AXK76297.1 hypothetical protein DXK33_15510 [Mycolicibacterium neoaurum]KUM09959.1 hypothetical protein AVZ31_03750 [Mycolicibacterium neoaurum]
MKLVPLAILCGVLFGPLGALCIVWAVINIGHGELLTALTAIGFAMFSFGFIAPFVKTVPGKVAPRGEFDDAGTTVRPDRGVDVSLQIALLGLTIASGLTAALVPLGLVEIPVPEQLRYALPFVAAVVALMGAPIVWRTLRRGSLKYLRLTPSGFMVAQGSRPQSGDWKQVVDITGTPPNQNAPTADAIAMVMSDDSVISMPGASFTPEGKQLREWVRFYWLHPDLREELTDERALKRLAE